MKYAKDLVLPRAALRAFSQTILGDAFIEANTIELIVSSREDEIGVREFAAYLNLLDGIYGRLDPLGFRSYAHRRGQQLEINRVSHGSLELTFLFDLLHQPEVWRAVTIYLIVKVGPSILKGEAVRNWAEAAKAVAETREIALQGEEVTSRAFRLSRAQKSLLRKQIQNDQQLHKLSKNHVSQLVRLVEQVLMEEQQNLPAASRYSEKYVQDVQLRPGKR